MKLLGIALLSASALAAAQPHQHKHRHPARHEKRDVPTVTTTVSGPIVTVYDLNGHNVPYSEVEAGLVDGKYVIVGATIESVISSSAAPSASSTEAAEFFEKVSSSSASESTSTYVAPTTSSTTSSATTTTSAAAAAATSSTATGSTADFPSGTIPCGSFPSGYGAVYVDWLDLGGWIGVQETPDYTPGDSSISYIVTATAGSSCMPNSFCSYACAAGQQKTQWPTAQGSTGQSIGGLYCNSDGYLELSRTSVSTLCESGVGGVQVTNNLSQSVAICRTDYPGTEAETVPLDVAAGATEPICNPSASNYYEWEGDFTSAQYYINPAGATTAEACIWGESGTNMGNWAPVNMGVGQGSTGVTYVSLFQNSPTNPTGVLDYTITITGGVSGECSYSYGTYYLNGVESSTGCTVSLNSLSEP